MPALSVEQVAAFKRTGCLVCPDAVTPGQLAAMRAVLDRWVEQSRAHPAAYGETLDGRPRFDLQPGHSADKPALRRVASPTELAPVFLEVLRDSPMMTMLAESNGPDLRLHHSKINSKLPGSGTVVDWHQDFTFDPHSNNDVVTCLVFLDAVTPDNGPLLTAPGSHRGPLHLLWHGGRFNGTMDTESSRMFEA